ncbi:hypothetical protein [Mycobacterium uberis]|uniref:hypothetical protein n=1 Tax=Mycobacterium uberis TaxID=2162698 RepID=UPI001FB380A5|nr:hypothetical protein [Mycobacterium uberis]
MSEGYVKQGQMEAHLKWFRTDDLDRLDDNHTLTDVDRIKDSLRKHGENLKWESSSYIIR